VEEVYVSGANTEKYRTFGAPHERNSLYIAQALEKHVIENNLENLEWAHIEIFDACLKQDFKVDELDQWLSIFSSLKNYFFMSLCYRDFSVTSIEILKRFFCNEVMQGTVIKVSFYRIIVFRDALRSSSRLFSFCTSQTVMPTASRMPESSSNSSMITRKAPPRRFSSSRTLCTTRLRISLSRIRGRTRHQT